MKLPTMNVSLLQEETDINIRPTILMSLSFSPFAVEMDSYATKLGSNSVIRCFLHKIAKLLSLITSHIYVEVLLAEQDMRVSGEISAVIAHSMLFGGQDVYVPPMVAAMLLWNINNARGLLEVCSAIRRADSRFHLTLDQRMRIMMAYNSYKKRVNVPSPDLMVIHNSVMKIGLSS